MPGERAAWAGTVGIPDIYPISVVEQNLEVVYARLSKRDGLSFLAKRLGVLPVGGDGTRRQQ